MSPPEISGRPLTIAHRAGNNLDRLREAEVTGVDLVEADVWLHRGQLEIRHEKTAGILPFLWDRWSLAAGWSRRLSLSDLLEAALPETHLLLDLKGVNRGLPTMVKRMFHAAANHPRIAVCSQNWTFVDAFQEQPEILRLYSIGSLRQLELWFRRPAERGPVAVSIDVRLLSAERTQLLRRQVEIVAPWGVKSVDEANQLVEWGATAINADDLLMLQAVKAGRVST